MRLSPFPPGKRVRGLAEAQLSGQFCGLLALARGRRGWEFTCRTRVSGHPLCPCPHQTTGGVPAVSSDPKPCDFAVTPSGGSEGFRHLPCAPSFTFSEKRRAPPGPPRICLSRGSEALANCPLPLQVSSGFLVLWVDGPYRGRGLSGSSVGGGAPSRLVGGAPASALGSSQTSRSEPQRLTLAARAAFGVGPRPRGPLASLPSERAPRYFRSTGNSQVFLVSSDYFVRHNSNPNSMA